MENVLMYVNQKWNQLTSFSKKEDVKNELWRDIVEHHTGPYRYYHNLHHVARLFEWSETIMPQMKVPAVTGFAILYHDIVYDTFKDNNEEESAAVARDHMQRLQVKESVIQQVETYILASKKHELNSQNAFSDLAWFLDLDLAILGAPWDEYEAYSEQIRKEYRQYPDAVYSPGRKNALEQLSEKEHLFFTSHFRDLLEAQARQNIFREIQLLS